MQKKEKGEASDAFKRACFNVGIGRELYTKIFIWLKRLKLNKKTVNMHLKTLYEKYHVSEIRNRIMKLKKYEGFKDCRQQKIKWFLHMLDR